MNNVKFKFWKKFFPRPAWTLQPAKSCDFPGYDWPLMHIRRCMNQMERRYGLVFVLFPDPGIGQHPTEEAPAWIDGFGSLYFEHLPQLESPWLTIYVDGGHPLAHAVAVLKAALDLADDEIEWVQNTASTLPRRPPRV